MFEIDQSVRTQGQIISKVRTQIIQAADGGVLSELFVSEGQEVEAGQVLAVLERGRAEAAYAESRAKSSALSIALSRANAESRLEVPVWSFESDGYSNFVQVQQKLCRQRGSIPASKSYQGVT